MLSYDIIRRPIITEQSMDQVADRKYTFEVAKNATRSKSRRLLKKSLRLKLRRLQQ